MDGKTILKNRIIKTAVITLAILIAEVGILFALYSVISNQTGEVLAKRQLLQSFKDEKANFNVLESDYEMIRPILPLVSGALPDEENLIKTVEGLDNIAKKVGAQATLKLESQEPVASGVEGVRYVIFTALVSGNYNILRNYLKEIDSSPIFISINSVNINSPNLASGDISASLKGKIYTK